MVEQTFPCHQRCEWLGITHLFCITLIVKHFFEMNYIFNPQDEIIQLYGANHPQISMKPPGGPINVINVPQQWCGDQTWRWTCLWIRGFPPNDDENGVGGLNYTPHLVKPLMIVTMCHVLGSYALFIMNLNLNLGIQL